VPEQKLRCPEMLGPVVDQGGLRGVQGKRAVRARVRRDHSDPLMHESWILKRRDVAVPVDPTKGQTVSTEQSGYGDPSLQHTPASGLLCKGQDASLVSTQEHASA